MICRSRTKGRQETARSEARPDSGAKSEARGRPRISSRSRFGIGTQEYYGNIPEIDWILTAAMTLYGLEPTLPDTEVPERISEASDSSSDEVHDWGSSLGRIAKSFWAHSSYEHTHT